MERIKFYTMSVKFSNEKMKEMENILKVFFDENNITLEIPVDIFKIATALGFDVRGTAFKKNLDGLIVVDERKTVIEPFTTNKIIAYDRTASLEHVKFIVGHELAHYIEEKYNNSNKAIVCAAREHTIPYSYDASEQRKDYMSAAILMPINAVQSKYAHVEEKTSEEFYDKVMSDFNVSREMAKRRIQEVFYAE